METHTDFTEASVRGAGLMLDRLAIPVFAIDRQHRVTYWNAAMETISGISADSVRGTERQWTAFFDTPQACMADQMLDAELAGDLAQACASNGWRPSKVLPGAYEVEGFVHRLGSQGMWLAFTATPLRDAAGNILGVVESLLDISDQTYAQAELKEYRFHLEHLIEQRTEELSRANAKLQEVNRRLAETHTQLLQSEKMASIGELAAGVAHEINNPVGFVNCNLGSMEKYVESLFVVIEGYDRCQDALGERLREIAELKRDVDYDFIRDDLGQLIAESRQGLTRVKNIVQALRDFAHIGSGERQFADLHAGMESVLAIMHTELASRATVVKEYGTLPEVECLPLELNQVFLNLLTNAAQALDKPGEIHIRSGVDGEAVWIEVADSGKGIAPEHLARIFDPFFTTKPVGQGTGLGLSLAYATVKKHHGVIEVTSEPGRGTTFRVRLPVRQPSSA